jgi:hypothetical protein
MAEQPAFDEFAKELHLMNAQDDIFKAVAALGKQHRENGTETRFELLRDSMHHFLAPKLAAGTELTWAEVISNAYYEVMAETDPAKLKVEVNKFAALCLLWSLDLRGN